jgi:hypothetical protein
MAHACRPFASAFRERFFCMKSAAHPVRCAALKFFELYRSGEASQYSQPSAWTMPGSRSR